MDVSKNKIITLPNKALRSHSEKITSVNSEIKKIVKDMVDATLKWEDSRKHEVGVALAAIQLNISKRIIVIRNNFDDKKDRTFNIYINPEITKYEGKKIYDFEGCLSIKDLYGKVPRYSKVKIKALNIEGKIITLTAKDFLARIFQHEIDHTIGKLFIDHIKNNKLAFYKLSQEGKLESINYEKININRLFR